MEPAISDSESVAVKRGVTLEPIGPDDVDHAAEGCVEDSYAVDLTNSASKRVSVKPEVHNHNHEIIIKGLTLRNTFSSHSFTPPLEPNRHLMQALAAFAIIGGAEPRGGGIAEILQASIKDGTGATTSLPIDTRAMEDNVNYFKPVGTSKTVPETIEVLNCSFCDYSCTSKRTLSVHIRKHDSSKHFNCSECSYTTSRSSDLKKHIRIHTGEKPFKCGQCDYKSTEQGALRKHMLTHTCDNPHCCPHCDYVSPRIGDLKRHMHVHSEKKPYACRNCDYRASQLQRLRKHMMIHTGLKPYQCTYCDYRCREPRNLKTHIQTHTGEKPYGCPHCQYRAGRLGSLRRHVSSIHATLKSSDAALPRHFLAVIEDQEEQTV